MVANLIFGLTLAAAAIASPAGEVNEIYRRQTAGSCRDQSCLVATVSGSTGATEYIYPNYPVGDTAGGDCCIIRYFPAAKNAIYANRAGLQAYCAANGGDAPLDSNPPGVTTVSLRYPPPSPVPSANPQPATGFTNPFANINTPRTGPCKSKVLIYVKGTFEFGDFGQTLGPLFQEGLDSSWDIRGLSYDNSLDNNYCLGLPGGVAVRTVLGQTVAQCPGSKIALVGYSQGAMGVRHALARATSAQVAAVKSVVNFGDPFLGAPIGQYNGPRHIYCDPADGVCSGKLNITLQHIFAYQSQVPGAIALINADVGA